MIERRLNDLLDKRLVFVTGKGGVGKSTVAAAIAMRSARAGRRTILCEVGAEERISQTFHRAEIGYHEVKLADELWAISIDPDESMREYLLLQLKVRAMRDLLYRSRIFTYLAAATPGLKELVTIGKIWELTLSQRKVSRGREYDLVVVDAPATGHGVGFLQTPRTFANVARVGPLRQQAETLDGFIRDRRRTGVAIVALPEEMPVNETSMLERTLDSEVGVQVDRIICNGLYPERFAAAEAERLSEIAGSSNGAARAACRSALSEFRRANAERDQLARLERLTEAPVTTLPYLFVEQLAMDEICELSELVG